jgi:hypothetical protein
MLRAESEVESRFTPSSLTPTKGTTSPSGLNTTKVVAEPNPGLVTEGGLERSLEGGKFENDTECFNALGLGLCSGFLGSEGTGIVSVVEANETEGLRTWGLGERSGLSGSGKVACTGESTVRDLRRGFGLGDTGGEFGGGLSDPWCCHLSNTLTFRELELGLSGVLVWLEEAEDVSICMLTLTMFWTNPLPFSLLILGVGSF